MHTFRRTDNLTVSDGVVVVVVVVLAVAVVAVVAVAVVAVVVVVVVVVHLFTRPRDIASIAV